MHLTRRAFLRTTGLLGLSVASAKAAPAAASEAELPPIRALTRGPKHHWFGYYDKLEFDPTGRYVLGMEVDFEHRAPQPGDAIRIGMVDLQAGDRWIDLGRSRAWCWQQGCMLQWLPGSGTDILWNDREGGRFICHILNVKTGRRRTVSHAIYGVSPDGREAISADFRRLQQVRPGYGYAGVADPNVDEWAPKDSGIWRIDLSTGRQELLLSLADVAQFGPAAPASGKAKHWFNHLLYSPDGSRFAFLHRWRGSEGGGGFRTRMLTASRDGQGLHVVDASGYTSHFIWRDPEHLLAWTQPVGQPSGFYLFRDRTAKVEQIGRGVMTQNGHCSYLPGNAWILNDTYPDKNRLQHPYLYRVASGRKAPLGHFLSPKEYAGEWRCDSHPRFSPDGCKVVIDSPHGGEGRQLHLIDISKVVG